MRGGQGETYRGSCSRSRAIMPYNLDATQTRSSDSMVGPWTASRPHPKSTPGRSPKAFCQSVREPLVRIYGALKGSLIYMDTWQARIASGPFNSESERAAVRFPHEAAQQVTRGIAARRLEGGVRPAALLGWAHDWAGNRVRSRTVDAVWSPGSSKVRKRERDSRIDLAKLRKTACFTDNEAPAKAIP